MDATKVRELGRSASGAVQALYRLEPPAKVGRWDGELAGSIEYVVVSAVSAMITGPETLIFQADADGNVTDWLDLPGSYRGGFSHDEAIAGLLEWVAER